MQIARDAVVSIHYKLTVEGKEIDASQPERPLTYLQGHGNIIPGLENALVGKSAGDSLDVQVAAAEAYGVRDAELDLAVPMDAFPEEVRPEIAAGFRFRAEHPKKEGAVVMFTVQQVEKDTVYCSGNHPLAGKDLTFAVQVAEVRAATEQELAHGHIHGGGGCCGGGGHGEGGCGEGSCGEGACGGEGHGHGDECCGGEGHDHQHGHKGGGCCHG